MLEQPVLKVDEEAARLSSLLKTGLANIERNASMIKEEGAYVGQPLATSKSVLENLNALWLTTRDESISQGFNSFKEWFSTCTDFFDNPLS